MLFVEFIMFISDENSNYSCQLQGLNSFHIKICPTVHSRKRLPQWTVFLFSETISSLSTGILEFFISVLPTVSGTQWLHAISTCEMHDQGVGDAYMYVVPQALKTVYLAVG